MRITNTALVDRFARRHRDVAQRLNKWKREVALASWSTPHDARREMLSARPVGNRRLIFNIKGNQYRIVAEIDYKAGALTVLFIGRHDDYIKFISEEF